MAAEDMGEVGEGNSIPGEDDQHYVVIEVRIRSGFASKLESGGIPHLQMIQLPEESGEEGVFQIAPVPTTNNRFRPCFSLATVCLRGGDQKKFLFWVNQWFYLVSLVQKIGDPSGAHQFLAFLPIFMAKNCPKKPQMRHIGP